jgi:hypothetical protein
VEVCVEHPITQISSPGVPLSRQSHNFKFDTKIPPHASFASVLLPPLHHEYLYGVYSTWAHRLQDLQRVSTHAGSTLHGLIEPTYELACGVNSVQSRQPQCCSHSLHPSAPPSIPPCFFPHLISIADLPHGAGSIPHFRFSNTGCESSTVNSNSPAFSCSFSSIIPVA